MQTSRQARILALLLPISLLSSLFLTAQKSDRIPPTAPWQTGTEASGHTYRFLPEDPLNARYYTLENGLTVILSVNTDEPRIQTLIAVRAGSKHDPATNTGLAHYLEHMLFKGTDRYGSYDWEKEKRELQVIEDLYDTYNKTTDEEARKRIYRAIDSVSGVAATYAIANEYDRMIGMIGATGTNAFTSTEQTVYVNNIPSNQVDRWLTIEAERFRAPVFRLFHTELEAVYEEKNRSLDEDGSKAYEGLMAEVFRNHPYGTQTTIGTIEHLKNPSLKEIRKYYDRYYVPNNMAIIMAGDFDPGNVIAAIDEKFSYMKPKEIPNFTFAPEEKRSEPTELEVVGPEAEQVTVAWRFPGADSKESLLLTMTDLLLAYKGAGMLELNLTQRQKVKNASSYFDISEDYSTHVLYGEPGAGQELEEVKDLMLAELDRIKRGEFDEKKMAAIVRNLKVDELTRYRSNAGRAYTLLNTFVVGGDPARAMMELTALSRLSKQDIVDFANKWYTDDYVVMYKREGEREGGLSVEKPEITPVSVNREATSPFVQKIAATKAPEITPTFIDYENDITKIRLSGGKGPQLLAIENEQDDLFELYYVLEMGSDNDPLLPYALDYLEYIGTASMPADELRKRFFELGCSYSVSSGRDQVFVSLSGPQESFEEGVRLFEEFLENARGDEESLEGMIDLVLQSRENAKADKGTILFSGLGSYAVYGPENPTTDIVSEDDLDNLQPDDLTDRIHKLSSWDHRVLYYGPLTPKEAATTIERLHPTRSSGLRAIPAPKVYKRAKIDRNTIYFVDFDMVQAEVLWLRDAEPYNADNIAVRTMFNEYFGGGMSSIVFQDIRESKALAYSTFSAYRSPNKPTEPHTIMSYVGAQADKLNAAITAMNALHNDLPQAEGNLSAAREALRNKYETGRTIRSAILFDYLTAEKFGFTEDSRRRVYDNLDKINLNDLTSFHDERYANVPYAICIIGSKEMIDLDALKQFGEVVELSIEDVLGY